MIILITLWILCGLIGVYLAKIDRDTHTLTDLIFAWLLGAALGPFTILLVLTAR